jgi:hypothetical protein
MKAVSRILLCLFFLVVSHLVSAQTMLTVSKALDFWITNPEKEVVSAADAMPEEKYSFAPTAGEFTGARTFAQQIKHLAANYRMAAYILTQTPTHESGVRDRPRCRAIQVADHGLPQRLIRSFASSRGFYQ